MSHNNIFGSFVKKLNPRSQPTLIYAMLRDDPSKGSQLGNALPLPVHPDGFLIPLAHAILRTG